MKYKSIAPIFISDTNKKSTSSNSYKPITNRKTRFDKSAVMKVPVTSEENIRLRTSYQEMKRRKNSLEPGSITEYLGMLLRFGLRNIEMLRPSDEYQNTEVKKTVKPNQIEKEMIEDLAIKWNLSERRTLHGIIFSVINYLDQGGDLTNEKVQPFRPVK